MINKQLIIFFIFYYCPFLFLFLSLILCRKRLNISLILSYLFKHLLFFIHYVIDLLIHSPLSTLPPPRPLFHPFSCSVFVNLESKAPTLSPTRSKIINLNLNQYSDPATVICRFYSWNWSNFSRWFPLNNFSDYLIHYTKSFHSWTTSRIKFFFLGGGLFPMSICHFLPETHKNSRKLAFRLSAHFNIWTLFFLFQWSKFVLVYKIVYHKANLCCKEWWNICCF